MASAGTEKKYDFVIFGATGYTGQYVIDHMARAIVNDALDNCIPDGEELTFAIAGRNYKKLVETRTAVAKEGRDVKNVPIIVADVKDELSLNNMAAQAKVVLNCVGPYRFFGEQVVKACIANNTHHVDISGEPQYLESMQLKYHKEAEKAGVYIVGACGFDSIPADVGQGEVHKAMQGPVNRIEAFFKVISPPKVEGPLINFATYQSAIYGFAHQDELKPIRKQLNPQPLPKTKPSLKKHKVPLRKDNLVNDWVAPFLGSDRSVMMRTQRARYFNDNKRPAQVGSYVQIGSLLNGLILGFFGILFGIMATFEFGRRLLEQYPSIFTGGLVTKEGPSKEMVKNTNFEYRLYGWGWPGADETDVDKSDKEKRKVEVLVKGKNIGYGATSECLVQSAVMIRRELDNLPSTGGVYTPGYAFYNTGLVDRLNKFGVTFEVSSQDI